MHLKIGRHLHATSMNLQAEPAGASPSTEPPAAGEDPPSAYGILALQTAPADAQVIVDGEAWAPVAGQSEFVIHLVAGWHQIEVRREGYQPFSMRVEMTEGQTTRLDANLVQR